jgi:hypothetical protein
MDFLAFAEHDKSCMSGTHERQMNKFATEDSGRFSLDG